MEWITDPQIWVSLVTLSVLEIVLGIDNLVFLAILADRLPEHQRDKARKLGLGFALITRLLLLSMLAWIIGLTEPVFTLLDHAVSWRDIILIGGGLFLLAKATHEIHGSLEGAEEGEGGHPAAVAHAGFAVTIIQIGILDIVFSLDSVITAVGMARQLGVMVAAVVIAMIVMLIAAGPLSAFVSRHPTVKMLALSFLLLIGMSLIADGLGFHIPKGYLYFAMGFSVLVEVLNLVARGRRKAVRLRTSL
ncbi:MAG: TerC family protein [Alphaproteobacteria bacterium]|nr:TerC family protein [Alphaproteobacteria bacterium]